MKSIIQNSLCYLLVIFTLLGRSSLAQDTSFNRVQLAYGISLEIPSHWTVLTQETRQNLSALSESITKNAGVELSEGIKEGLLAVNAAPEPTGAMIRISIISPPDYTQADLVTTTPENLGEMGTAMLDMMKQFEVSGGPKIIKIQPLHIEKLNNYNMLVIPYIRDGINGTSPWQVTQYKIPVTNKIIEITLSHRQSESIIWQPILEYVKRSVQF